MGLNPEDGEALDRIINRTGSKDSDSDIGNSSPSNTPNVPPSSTTNDINIGKKSHFKSSAKL